MIKWQRAQYIPVAPLGEEGTRITGSLKHRKLSRKAAAEGMVLLKNKDVLPLEKGEKVVLLGKATIDYVKGGGGSGDVYCEYVRTIADGFFEKQAEGKVLVFPDTVDFYKDYVAKQYENGKTQGTLPEVQLPSQLVKKAADFSQTAIISICRYSGEGWDRRISPKDDIRTEYAKWEQEEAQRAVYEETFAPNDFYLTEAEKELIETAKENFRKVVVVLNIGGVIDTDWTKDEEIGAVLISWQGGMEGGCAAADILCGDVNPSGHLTDTFASKLSDYPSVKGFHDNAEYVCYTEDIYVGYRYFSTIPGAAQKVNYPFGYGLSYTDFSIRVLKAKCENDEISFETEVTNTGKIPGREVVQLYFAAPSQILQKPARQLVAFSKTDVINPGQSDKLLLTFKVTDMKSFDDTGAVKDASWVLEKGTYSFFIGNNVRDAFETEFKYELHDNVIIETTGHKVIPQRLAERLLSDGSMQKLELKPVKEDNCRLERQDVFKLEGLYPETKGMRKVYANELIDPSRILFKHVFEGRMTLDEFMEKLSLEERIDLLCGQPNVGVATTCGMGNNAFKGIPNIMTADGPAGLRILPEVGVPTTAWPIETLLACTWDTQLVENIGNAVALEIKENNIGIWLAPGCNIHRSPLCGRNFEYFSEDPLLTGKLGAAVVRGVQKEHIAATPKHFAANNKETNRKKSDSVVSERALREIYLRQFEIIVKEAKPYIIMSSYNRINGAFAAENEELLTGILRDEWGFDGVVTSDWWNLSEHYLEVKAGGDIKMACGYQDRIMEALEKGYISEEEINRSARRILELILKID